MIKKTIHPLLSMPSPFSILSQFVRTFAQWLTSMPYVCPQRLQI
jgi:hypothetical protein